MWECGGFSARRLLTDFSNKLKKKQENGSNEQLSVKVTKNRFHITQCRKCSAVFNVVFVISGSVTDLDKVKLNIEYFLCRVGLFILVSDSRKRKKINQEPREL